MLHPTLSELTQLLNSLKEFYKKARDEKSSFYQAMSSTLRYERYMINKAQAVMRNPDFELFGHSFIETSRNAREFCTELYPGTILASNIYEDSLMVAGIAREVGALENFHKQIKVELEIVSLPHDLGELEMGDVTYEDKTEHHDRLELRYVTRNFPIIFESLGTRNIDLLQDLYEQYVYEKKTLKAIYFKVLERLGYVETSRAEFVAKSSDMNWPWLCGNVAHHQGVHLLQAVDIFKGVRKFLSPRKDNLLPMVQFLDQNRGPARDFNDMDRDIWYNLFDRIAA